MLWFCLFGPAGHWMFQALMRCFLFFQTACIYTYIYTHTRTHTAAPALGCDMQDLRSLLSHAGSLAAPCKLLVAGCGIYFPDQK